LYLPAVSIADVNLVPRPGRLVEGFFSARRYSDGGRIGAATMRKLARCAQSAYRALQSARGILPGIVDAAAGESDRSLAVILMQRRLVRRET